MNGLLTSILHNFLVDFIARICYNAYKHMLLPLWGQGEEDAYEALYHGL